MDWTLAIERNTIALKRIVAMLFTMAGLAATPTSASTELRGRSSDRAGGSIVGREGRRDCEAIGVPGRAARSDAGGGGDAAPDTPTRPSDDLRPPSSRGRLDHPSLPRRLHRAVLRLLRPAESAVRRLIVIAARGLVVPPSRRHLRKPAPPSIFLPRGSHGTGVILPRGAQTKPPRPSPLSISLPLFDPLKRPFRRHRPTPICEPRISYPGPFNRLSPVKLRQPPSPDDRLDSTRLTLRINALAAALDDLPRQAHRLARWRANRERDKNRDSTNAQEKCRDAQAAFLAPTKCGRGGERGQPVRGLSATSKVQPRPRLRCISPLRPGRPPGALRRPDNEVHDLLTDLHGLAFDVLEQPDTS